MAFEYNDIRTGQEIFYYLLKRHELREESEPRLYRAYFESEDVQHLVKSQGEVADCMVERYGNVIYLIPNQGNYFLGFSKSELKDRLCKSNSKTRDYLRVGDLMNSVSERLKEGAERLSEEEQDEEGIAFSDMREAYEALKLDESGKKQKTTKEGFIHHILLFLEKQGLIEYVVSDEMILTTKKFDNFMDWNILNDKNYDRISKVLGVRKDGQD